MKYRRCLSSIAISRTYGFCFGHIIAPPSARGYKCIVSGTPASGRPVPRTRRYAVIGRSTQVVAVSCILMLSAVPALAKYPAKPITLIVPFSAGGASDAVARIVGEHMAKTLGQPIIIENDGGAGGTT